MKGKIIVIEGLDGSGKSTQIELLRKYLDSNNIKNKYLHFPLLNKGVYGTLISEFLRGEFGSLYEVHPKIVALLFANDRQENIHIINQWVDDGYYVLLDRYIYSNITYQCSKIEDSKKEDLKQWIYEYEFSKIPKPDKSFFLNVNMSTIEHRLTTKRTGEDRDYLNGKKDIHEDDLLFQKKVALEYQKINELIKIECSDNEGNPLTPQEINLKIINQLDI